MQGDQTYRKVNPEYSLEGLMLKMKLLIFWPPDVKNQLTGKRLFDAGKDWGKRSRRWQRMRWLDSITDSMGMNLSKVWEIVEDRGAWRAAVHWVTKNQIQLRD